MITTPANVNEPDRFHYYCMAFNYSDGITYGFCCCYMGFEKQNISRADIEYSKIYASPGEGITEAHMVLIAATYLGLMTAQEFDPNATI